MRSPVRSLLGLALLGAAALSATASADEAKTPYDVVHDLRRLQDRIAAGDTVAEATHAKAIARTARDFADAPAATWKDPRNARALIAYLFSGGNASTIADAIPEDAVPPDLKTLYSGALAYGLGNDAEARKELMSIDPKTMPNGISGHLALVEAILSTSDDQAKAIGLLDLARLLEPGTLVEEAALRKEMSLIGATGDIDKFALLSRRYLNVFPRSIYADNFRQLVAETAVNLGSGDSDEATERLTKLMSGLDKTEQRRLYLMIARHAVIAGHLKMATLASLEARSLSQDSKIDEARALTYYGAATITGDDYDKGLKALADAGDAPLDRRDRALRDAALSVADMIRTPATTDKTPDPTDDPQAATLAAGERSLSAADDLLKGIAK